MNRQIGQTILVVIVFAMGIVGIAPSVSGQQCSMTGAAGKYGFSDSGTIVGIGPRAAVGLLTFDAEGNIHGVITASLNGSIAQTTLSGKYSVSSDCTGTASFSELDQSGNPILTATVAIVWDTNMREARFLFTSVVLADGTSLSTVINGDARKLVP